MKQIRIFLLDPQAVSCGSAPSSMIFPSCKWPLFLFEQCFCWSTQPLTRITLRVRIFYTILLFLLLSTLAQMYAYVDLHAYRYTGTPLRPSLMISHLWGNVFYVFCWKFSMTPCGRQLTGDCIKEYAQMKEKRLEVSKDLLHMEEMARHRAPNRASDSHPHMCIIYL